MKRLLLGLWLAAIALAVPRPELPEGTYEYPPAKKAWEHWSSNREGVEYRIARTPRAWDDPQPSDWCVHGFLQEGAIVHAQSVFVDREGLSWLRCLYNGKLYAVRATYQDVTPAEREPLAIDAEGNFTGPTLHRYFKVVDPEGLNGRWSETDAHPGEDVAWPTTDINTWPVRQKFPPGAILIGVQGNRGVLLHDNIDGKVWMVVKRFDVRKFGHDEYLVRANTRYLKPIDGP